MKIGNTTFSNYQEYESAYVKKWEQIHGLNSIVDLNWVKKDWETRLSNPELYK